MQSHTFMNHSSSLLSQYRSRALVLASLSSLVCSLQPSRPIAFLQTPSHGRDGRHLQAAGAAAAPPASAPARRRAHRAAQARVLALWWVGGCRGGGVFYVWVQQRQRAPPPPFAICELALAVGADVELPARRQPTSGALSRRTTLRRWPSRPPAARTRRAVPGARGCPRP